MPWGRRKVPKPAWYAVALKPLASAWSWLMANPMILVAILVCAIVTAVIYMLYCRKKDTVIRQINEHGGIIFDTVPNWDFGHPALNWYMKAADAGGIKFNKCRNGVNFRPWFRNYVALDCPFNEMGWENFKVLLDDLSYMQQCWFYTGILTIAHMFRWGTPDVQPPQGYKPEWTNPPCVKKPMWYLAEVLDICHSHTAYTFGLCNWTHKTLPPGHKFTNAEIADERGIVLRFAMYPGMGSTKENPKNLQAHYGKFSSGAEYESMIGFFCIETAAAPMYQAMMAAFKNAFQKNYAGFKRDLMNIKKAQDRINQLWVNHVSMTDPDDWQDLQGMAHWDDGETVGVSGYQACAITALDVFLGVPHPHIIRENKHTNIIALPIHVRKFVQRLELQRHIVHDYIKEMKDPAITSILCQLVENLLSFRSRHLARSKNYLRRASTAGHSGGEYRDVYKIFSEEMKLLINSTKIKKEEFQGKLKERRMNSVVTAGMSNQARASLSAVKDIGKSWSFKNTLEDKTNRRMSVL